MVPRGLNLEMMMIGSDDYWKEVIVKDEDGVGIDRSKS